MTAFLLACAGLVTATSTARAVNGDGTSPFATYNMHGSDNGSRWTSEVAPLAATNQLVALQEAGAGPPLPAHDNDRSEFRQIRLTPNRAPQPSSVQRVTWAGGPNGSNRYVYFLQTNPRRVAGTDLDTWDGGQMNLAFVADTPADDVRVLENPAYNPDPTPPTTATGRVPCSACGSAAPGTGTPTPAVKTCKDCSARSATSQPPTAGTGCWPATST
ncbi:hypothetical protein [Streptomyces rimosus]|uniref:hypothetical protein n=1 Tax=Streptomyces rimosus TaxID=1927 RepID=UPI0020B766E2|nr:hypothetical protein [Streptomyces rimosus]UTJ10868.1 hypothetical protein SRIMDV3_01295 [Streptomyces rimosus subsp. rimosus]UTJ18101.1 hypothetical protein SRIMDV3_38250 [Streptomyces rimosus subsp. rimosus]UTJ19529.1 hypothetical protein SRIMDV3_45515 [Streptomyces rimosus subsp. rimosus]